MSLYSSHYLELHLHLAPWPSSISADSLKLNPSQHINRSDSFLPQAWALRLHDHLRLPTVCLTSSWTRWLIVLWMCVQVWRKAALPGVKGAVLLYCRVQHPCFAGQLRSSILRADISHRGRILLNILVIRTTHTKNVTIMFCNTHIRSVSFFFFFYLQKANRKLLFRDKWTKPLCWPFTQDKQ